MIIQDSEVSLMIADDGRVVGVSIYEDHPQSAAVLAAVKGNPRHESTPLPAHKCIAHTLDHLTVYEGT